MGIWIGRSHPQTKVKVVWNARQSRAKFSSGLTATERLPNLTCSSFTYLTRENLFGQWTQVANNNACFKGILPGRRSLTRGRRGDCLPNRRSIVLRFQDSRADIFLRPRSRDAGLLRSWHPSWRQRVSPTHVHCKNSKQNYELQLAVHGHGLSRQRYVHSSNNGDPRLLQRRVSSTERAGRGLGSAARGDHRIYPGDGERPTGLGVVVLAWRGN